MTRLPFADPQFPGGAPRFGDRTRRVGRELRIRERQEEGSALPLVVGLFVIAVSFVLVAAAATSLHLERLRLLTVADGAALAGAESFAVADVTVHGDRVVPTLANAEIRAAVDGYAANADPGDLDDLAVVTAGTTDGRAATVQLRAVWHPPIVSSLLPAGVPVTVTSTAAARFR